MTLGDVLKIIAKAGCVAVIGTFVSLMIGFLITYSMGLGFGPIAITITVTCAMLVGWPATFLQLLANHRTKLAKNDAVIAHAELEAMHLELKRLHQELSERHRRDSLTGVLNREAFVSELERRSNEDTSGSLFMIDADHFKAINDQHGHAEGDVVLQAITSSISKALPEDAILGRIGGEEFAIYFQALSTHAAFHLAERVRDSVEHLTIISERGGRIKPTISLGGVLLAGRFDVSQAMREADRNLYQAKSEGRNRTVIGNLPLAKAS